MAGNIKGIIVEIGGDTSGLQNALKKVNSSTSSLSKELRGVNSLLKLDPKNTELTAQKQEILKNNIEQTSKKLEELRKAQEMADNTIANGGEISQENYRNLQREIINTENKLKELKVEASKWTTAGRSIEEFGNKVTNISNKIDKMGTTLTTRLTLPILGVATGLISSAKEFETAFTGVEKTVDGTATQMENLKQGIKDLSEEIPSSTTEISAVAEAAGQLGIQTDNVLEFTKTMINMGNATNLSADEAATTLARFANVTKMSQADFNKLGSVIVALGNNFATTEAEIADMGMNLASAGTQVGMSQSQIMALATALSSVGLEAQAGGTAFSKVMVNMQLAVEKGGKDLKNFATVAGMSSKDFQKAFKEDATNAIMQFVDGLSKSGERGKSAIKILDDMGITETRLRDALLRSANASEVMSNAIEVGNKAWNENTALTDEASKRYQTLDSRMQMTKNKILNVATNTGNKLTPAFNKLLDKVDGLIDKFDGLNEEEVTNIIKTAALVAAVGPAVKIIGTLGKTIGTGIKTVGTFSQAVSLMGKTSTDAFKNASTGVQSLAKGLTTLTSPAGIATMAVVVATAAIANAIKNAEKETKDAFSNMGNGATDFINGINSATSHLDSFNSTLFASSEEQQKLQEDMDNVQKGITEICKRASDERRDYTQEEITQLNEYFNKLRELKNRELEIQKSISGAITQQAQQESQTFQGTLEQYKIKSQEWIKTAQEQADKQISIVNDRATQEIALLQQKYGEKATLENQEYAREFNAIQENKNKAIQEANDEVAQVNLAYANGYLERAKQSDGFYNTLTEGNSKIEEEKNRHNAAIEGIENNALLTQSNKNGAKWDEQYRHKEEMKDIWNNMYKNMSDEQEKELGTWLAMVAQTEMYGGKIDTKTEELVDGIIDSYDNMPKGTKEAMKNAMEPMLTEMEKKEPSLFSKASGIADGILSRLKKSFDIHSPSKETRKIFKYVMEGAELGLQDEEKNIYKQIDKFTANTLDKLNNVDTSNFKLNASKIQDFGKFQGSLSNQIADNTKTIFTTPQIVFNVQELDEAKLQQCFNYINKKFGSAY